jgi:phage terminase Nu1 subunit (DNA packaging protein)
MPSLGQAVVRRRAPTTPVRDRLAAAQAERAERINRTEAGELVPSKEVEAMWLDIVLTIRTRLLAIPARVAARHPGHPAIITTLEQELHSALNSIADQEL